MKNTGGPAFPAGLIDPATPEDALHPMDSGMTLRDYFAAKAMQAIISDGWYDGNLSYDESCVAKNAYKMADAMLKAREE